MRREVWLRGGEEGKRIGGVKERWSRGEDKEGGKR